MRYLFRYCSRYLKDHRFSLFFYILLCIIGSLFSLVGPYISGNFIDYLVLSSDSNHLVNYCILFAVISLIGLIFGYFTNRLYMKLQTKISFELNRDIICHIQKITLSFFKTQDTAYLNQQVNSDVNAIVTFCISVIQNILVNAITAIVPFILLFFISKSIFIILCILTIFYWTSYISLKRLLFKSSYEIKEIQSKYFGKLYEQISNIPFIKINVISEVFIKRLNMTFRYLFKSAMKYQRVTYMFSGLDTVITTLAQISLFSIGGISVIRGTLSIGSFTIVSTYFGMMLGAVRYFFNLGKTVQDNMVSYNRLIRIKNIHPETNGKILLSHIDMIEIKNLSFSYDNKKVIDNLSLKLEKGNIYIFKGSNGTGKTTLINLLMGLYIDEFDGNIFYNNKSIKEINMLDTRKRLIGVCEQEPSLMNATIAFNLFLNDIPLYDTARFRNLIKTFELESFINSTDKGIDTVISEKSDNLSGGEKQKISILRTLLKNPELIILDEPTSALDKKSRNQILNYLQVIKSDKIVIVVTHDENYMEIADKLVLF